ncbi:adenosylcobinamide-GDP ribazoletransferase [Alphaproteobacteria bacterium LSUCC0719]
MTLDREMDRDRDRAPSQSPFGDCAAAFLLLSRIPTGWYRFPAERPPNFTSALWAFPLVGLVIGGAGGAILVTGAALGLPPLASASLALLGLALLSGAMHEDGLADMADGFGGGRDSNDIIRIMHDSRIGAYGVLALILATALRLSLLALSLEVLAGWHLVGFMAMIGAASRFQPVLQLSVYSVSPHASLAALTGRTSITRLIVALFLWAPAMIWILGLLPTACIALPACALSLWIGRVATRKIDGLTGDVMGATTLCGEIMMLISWASVGAMLPA